MQGDEQRRDMDVFVYGATGYTGQNIALELAARATDAGRKRPLSIGIGGRNEQTLNALAEKIRSVHPAIALQVHVVPAEVESLVPVCKQATAVISACGPFVLHGTPVVEACIHAKTHYIDITGEYNWVAGICLKLGAAAAEAGVLVVSSCGYDSTVAEVGCAAAKKACVAAGDTPSVCRGYFTFKGTPTLTNGTLESILNMAIAEKLPPPVAAAEAPPGPFIQKIGESLRKPQPVDLVFSERGKLATPRLSQAPDGATVIWTNKLQDGPVDFQYANYMVMDQASLPFMRKLEYFVIFLFGMGVAWWPGRLGVWSRKQLMKLRGHAAGPSEEDVARSSAEALFDCEGVGGKHSYMHFTVPEMYKWTAISAVQSALCIIDDFDRLPRRAGCASPMAAFGDVLSERLSSAPGASLREVDAVTWTS